MPDAIGIISQVLEEMEDEEDSMDIDSGSGQKSKYVAASLIARPVP